MAIHDWNYGGKKNGTSSGNYSRDSDYADGVDDAMDEFDGDW